MKVTKPEIHQQFEELREKVAEAHQFPELETAQLTIIDNGHNEKRDDVFPMREVESRSIKFEFSQQRYRHFSREFSAKFNDQPIHERGIKETGLFLFIGAAVVRPVLELDQMMVVRSGGPRHVQVLRNFYGSSKDIDATFGDIFGNSADGNKVVAGEIKDSEVQRINGYRVALSYLYRSFYNDVDKKALLSELLRDSQSAIKENVEYTRPWFREHGRAVYGRSEGGMIGDFLTATTLPSWLVAMACPMTEQSYKHLGSELWDEKFYIEPPEACASAVDVGTGFVFDDEKSQLMPSTYTTTDV